MAESTCRKLRWNQRINRAWMAGLLLFISICLTACGKKAEENKESITYIAPVEAVSETVTVMIYMNGSDLESKTAAATSDMEEMAGSGVDVSKVNVLVFTGGATGWHNFVSPDVNAVYLLNELGFELLEEFEPMSMGDAANLTRFLSYAYDNFKADTYDLIFWDHGNGPVMGYGIDRLYDNDTLTLPELSKALKDSPFSEENKFGFVGFDACLMASVELACAIAPYSDYLVASQETEPGFGWNYEFLKDCGRLSSVDLANNIVRCYLDYCEEYYQAEELFHSDVTLSVMDLTYAEALRDELNVLFATASDRISANYTALARARVEAKALGRGSTGSEYDLVDLSSLMSGMSDKYPKETGRIQELIDAAILVNGTNFDGCCGMSMYYPFFNKKYYEKSWGEEYNRLETMPEYAAYLERYSKIWLGTDMQDYFTGTLTPGDNGNSTYSLQLTKEQQEYFANAGYLILMKFGDNVYCPIFYGTDVTYEDGKLTANFDGNVICLDNELGEKRTPFMFSLDTHGTIADYSCNVMLIKYDENRQAEEVLGCELVMALDKETGEVSVKGLYEDNGEDGDDIVLGKRKEVKNLADWDTMMIPHIHPAYLTRNENGMVEQYLEWEEVPVSVSSTLSAKAGLKVSYEPLYSDEYEYFIMFHMSDLQGNKFSSEILPITLKEAPSVEEPKEIEVDWVDGEGTTLISDENLSVKMEYIENPENGNLEYYLMVENRTGETLQLETSNFILNDRFDTGRHLETGYLIKGIRWDEMYGINSTLMNMESELKSLKFAIRVNSASKVYVDTTRVQVNFDGSPAATKKYDASYGALAEKQVLLETDEVTVTLNWLGKVYKRWNADYMDFQVEVHNKTEQEMKVNVLGLCVNGVAMGSYEICTVVPSRSQIINSSIFNRIKTDTDIKEVGDVEVILNLNDEGIRYLPVKLSQKGQPEPKTYDNILYEDENITMYLLNTTKQATPKEGQFTYKWWVRVENRTKYYYDYLSLCPTEEYAEKLDGKEWSPFASLKLYPLRTSYGYIFSNANPEVPDYEVTMKYSMFSDAQTKPFRIKGEE